MNKTDTLFIRIPEFWKVKERAKKLKFATIQNYVRELIRRDIEGEYE
jgi:hypothetical protein